MAIVDPKTRTVSFRFSEQEYAMVDQVCREQNFQSMSVFVRWAVLAYCQHAPLRIGDNELGYMKRRLEALVNQVNELSKRYSDRDALAPSAPLPESCGDGGRTPAI